MTKAQASLYQAVLNGRLTSLEKAQKDQRCQAVLEILLRLKQVCDHPALFQADNSPVANTSGKLNRLIELLEIVLEAGEHALVFTQFKEMGEILQQRLQQVFGQEVLFLHGGLPKEKRDEMVDRFQKSPLGPAVFVLSLKAGGTGLNLTRANHVFHFDRWWNPAVEDQGTDRTFRIGQQKDVQVYQFICVGTMEEKINEIIEGKRVLTKQVIGVGENWLADLSTPEIKELFKLREDAAAE